MPRIDAASIEEHVRNQVARILDAAGDLFREQGFRGTDMAAISARVGLARNSLYRYFPNKEHILVACVERDMGPFVARLEALVASHPDPRARIDAWIDMALDMAAGPAHATLGLMGDVQESPPELRRQILKLHDAPAEVLEGAVRAVMQGQKRDPALVTALIAGMVQSGQNCTNAMPSESASPVSDPT